MNTISNKIIYLYLNNCLPKDISREIEAAADKDDLFLERILFLKDLNSKGQLLDYIDELDTINSDMVNKIIESNKNNLTNIGDKSSYNFRKEWRHFSWIAASIIAVIGLIFIFWPKSNPKNLITSTAQSTNNLVMGMFRTMGEDKDSIAINVQNKNFANIEQLLSKNTATSYTEKVALAWATINSKKPDLNKAEKILKEIPEDYKNIDIVYILLAEVYNARHDVNQRTKYLKLSKIDSLQVKKEWGEK